MTIDDDALDYTEQTTEMVENERTGFNCIFFEIGLLILQMEVDRLIYFYSKPPIVEFFNEKLPEKIIS